MNRLILAALGCSLLPLVFPAAATTMPAAAAGVASEKRIPDGEDALRLQVFLDQLNFGPGVIDGKAGRFTELAVKSWNEMNGHPVDDLVAVMKAASEAVREVSAVVTVPAVATEWVDPKVPHKRSALAGLKRVSYRSFAEFMAERHHTNVPFLIELNGEAAVRKLRPGDPVTVPNVTPFLIENLTGARHEAADGLSQRHVVVDTKINQMRVFEAAPAALVVEPVDGAGGADQVAPRANRGLIASFPITPGQPQFIRLGTWELRNMIELPWWGYDPQFLKTGRRSGSAIQIPPGPNSPVGVIWNGTSRSGIGLHGTSDPETIGRARSAGCIRLANWDAVRLPSLIRPGATVEIR